MKKLIKSGICGIHEQCIYILFTKDRSTVAVNSAFFLFFFFFKWKTGLLWTVYKCTVHESHKLHFLSTFSLKMGLMILFTYLKIILLRYFQFPVFNFNKISSIQTDPGWHNWTSALRNRFPRKFVIQFIKLHCKSNIWAKSYKQMLL